MHKMDPIAIAVIAATILLVLLVGFVALLLVVNADRRHRHRAELAEMHMRRSREIMLAEREATRETLRDVGRELHDNVGQLLTVTHIGLSGMLEAHPDPRLSASRDALELGIAEIRRLGRTLNTDMWEDRTLQEAIREEAERLERVGRVKANLTVESTLPDMAPEQKTILFRVIQEIIANALRHGRADAMEIRLEAGPSIRVSDNGTGFDPHAIARKSGIRNIHKRCALIGYSAICDSAPGRGTHWTIQYNGHGT